MCNLHWCYTFCTGVTLFALVLHLNCTALSQSESSNFFMYIINIETGRYDKLSRFDRICPVCGLNVEDEIHFLFDCPKMNSSIRDDFFNN